MLLDEINLTFKAGNGGPGKVSFFPGKKSGPDGGNGGRGGDIYVVASPHMSNLNKYLGKHSISGKNGEAGGSNHRFGANGEDIDIDLPIGSLIIDQETKEELELLKEGERFLVCFGGKGGKGNSEFKSSTNTTPRYAQKGLPGEKRNFLIIMRMIADYGLIGLPNAGKSSLLNELTNTSVKTANYPFTTLEPNLGVFRRKVIADIPGLIEGASIGKGLGIKFLKHIEKVKLLIHCISSESDNVTRDYKTVIKELKQYSPALLEKQQIVVLTKTDLIDKIEADKKIKELKKLNKEVVSVSIHDWDSLEKFKEVVLH